MAKDLYEIHASSGPYTPISDYIYLDPWSPPASPSEYMMVVGRIFADMMEMSMIGMTIKKVIFNPPATIVFWTDGTKTVVKANDEPFDWEKGIAMAYVKKSYGNNKGRYYNLFRRFKEEGERAQLGGSVDET